MTAIPPIIDNLQLNLVCAKLPSFYGKGVTPVRFGDVMENSTERVESAHKAREIYTGLDDLDSGNLHIWRSGNGGSSGGGGNVPRWIVTPIEKEAP